MNEQNIIDIVEDLKVVKEEIIQASNLHNEKEDLYFDALGRVQDKLEKINKSGKGNFGKYLTYEDLVNTIHKPLREEGFVYFHKEDTIDGIFYEITTLRHKNGHKETTKHPIASISEFKINMQHGIATGNTYGKKIGLGNLVGVSKDGLIDDDADSVSVHNGLISITHLKKLQEILILLPPQTEKNLLDAVGISSLKELKLSQFNSAHRKLSERLEAQNENN